MVVVTSVKAARRRLRYESWHLLHLYAYLGVGLALPHQLWTGQEFLSSPGRDRLLVGRCGSLAAGAVLVWRVGAAAVAQRAAPAPGHLGGARGRRHRVGLRDRPPPATGCRPRPASSSPGASSAGAGWTRANPYSLSAAPDGRSLRITVKDVGDGSAALRGACGPAPGCWSRARTAGSAARARTRRKVAADRRRRRHHAAAGAGRGARLRPRRRGPAAPLHRRAALRRASSSALAARARAAACSTCPGRRRAAGLLARATASARADDLAALRLLGARHRRARRLRLRPRGLGRRASAAPPRPPACPPTASTSRPSGGDPMKTHRPAGS